MSRPEKRFPEYVRRALLKEHAQPASELVPDINQRFIRLTDRTRLQGCSLYVSENPLPNAFCYGPAAVCITNELLKVGLTPKEMDAVLLHELGHAELKHHRLLEEAGEKTVKFCNFWTRVAAALYLITDQIEQRQQNAGGEYSRRQLIRNGGKGLVTGLIAFKGADFLARFACDHGETRKNALLREQEHDADKFAQRIMADPEPLISALQKISNHLEAKGFDVLAGETHPSHESRVQQLRQR